MDIELARLRDLDEDAAAASTRARMQLLRSWCGVGGRYRRAGIAAAAFTVLVLLHCA